MRKSATLVDTMDQSDSMTVDGLRVPRVRNVGLGQLDPGLLAKLTVEIDGSGRLRVSLHIQTK
jgi:hypothetical protein